VHRVALVVDPSPALLGPLVRGLADVGYDVAFSAPAGAGRGLAGDVRRGGRRAFALERSLDADLLVQRVRVELGRLDLVVVEPARAEASPALASSDPSTDVGTGGPPAVGAARAALELLGESGGSIVRLLRPTIGDGESRIGGADVSSTRRLGRSLGARVRVNAVAVPREHADGVGTDRTAGAVVRAVLWLAGSSHLNGEVVSIDDGHDGPSGARRRTRRS
jgi:hypothetical protein